MALCSTVAQRDLQEMFVEDEKGREIMEKETALKLYEIKFWEKLPLRQRAIFQLNEERLCMPFDVFQEAVSKTLGRSVFTHEFAHPELLIKEIRGEKTPPTLAEIMAIIPSEKRIIITV